MAQQHSTEAEEIRAAVIEAMKAQEEGREPAGMPAVLPFEGDGADGPEVLCAESGDSEPLTPEEAEARALEDLFSLVREASADGKLISPAYYEDLGVVPSHMEAIDLEMLVYDLLAGQPNEEENPDAPASASAPAVERTDGDGGADDAGKPSVSMAAAAVAAPSAVPSDIALLEGKSTYYLYSQDRMTDAYARWAFLAEEDDDAMTLVQCAREESRLYPRPLKAASLENPPFNMTKERVEAAFEAVVESGAFPDIQTTKASNGDVYYFSTDHLSPTYAESLAEWHSVERRRNM